MTRAKDISKILTDADISGTLDVTGETTLATHLNMGDGDIIKLGASADLTIQHDGSDSKITDSGTGNLVLDSDGTEVRIMNGSEFMGRFQNNDAVKLFFDNSKKFETTSTGVDITGGFTATDGCTITTADNTEQLTLQSTDADATVGPIFSMKRDSSSPADNDALGYVKFVGENDASEEVQYVYIQANAVDVSDGTEDGAFEILTQVGGAGKSRINLEPTETVFNDTSADIDFRVESNDDTHALFVDANENLVNFFGTDANPGNNTGSSRNVVINSDGKVIAAAYQSEVAVFNRMNNDGTVIIIRQEGTEEGSISVSGSTTSYNAFSGSHWSRLTDNSKPTILKGTIVETIDEMCDWYQAKITIPKTEDNPESVKKVSIALPNDKSVGDTISYTYEGITYDDAVIIKEDDDKHTKCKISDTADSKSVYGVFADWDADDDTVNDMYVTAVGTHVVRINKDITVSAGDLLSSNGDGTAKVQDDDIIRSKTIGKVLTNIKQETYSDGSYTVPCALYCG